MLKGLKITLFVLLAVFSVGFLADLQIAEASVTSEITVNVEEPDPFQLIVNIDGNGSGTVSSDPSGISCPESCIASYPPETSVTLTASASAGSTFSSWAGCNPVNENTCTVLMDEAKTVTATFDLNTYTVTFNANGGTGTMSPQTFTASVGKNLSTNDFTRTGYNFAGWNTSPGGTGTSYSDRQFITVNSDMTLYARWNETPVVPDTYTVTFNANGGTGTMSPQTFTASVGKNLSTNDFTRTGYNFAGWNTSPGGTGTSYSDRQFITVNSDMTLYARWNETPVVPDTYTVTFNANGGTRQMDDQIFVSNTSQPLSLNQFTKIDSVFAGWSRIPTGQKEYNNGELITVSEDMTLYAIWMSGTITANPNPCQIAEGQSTCNTTLTWSVQNPISTTAVTTPVNQTIFTGHSGSGTYSVEHGGRTFYLYNNSIELGQIRVGAICASGEIVDGVCREKYTVRFDPNGGTGQMDDQTFVSNTSQSLSLNQFTNEGSTFDGWETTLGGIVYSYTDGQEIIIDSDRTLYAKWKSIPIIPMEGEINASSCLIPDNQNSCDTTLTWSVQNPISTTAVTTPVDQTIFTGHSGSGTYTLNHGENRWFFLYNNGVELDQDLASATCASVEATEVDGFCRQEYRVSFDPNGGTRQMDDQIFVSNTPQSISLNQFTKIDSVFAGWSRTPTGQKEYNNGELITVSEDMTLYAIWMSGTITANPNPCQIAEGQSTCDTTIAWSVQNPISTTAVTTPVNQTIFTGHSGLGTYSVEHGGRTFYLYNNSIELGQIRVSADCEGGTSWLGSSCEGPKELIVSRNGAGTVTSDVYGISCGSDCSGVYAHGSRVTLTATVTEADNSMFSSWSAGCDEVNGNTCTVLMNEDKNVTANFMEVWVDAQSSVEGSSIYNTIPNTIITIPYTTSSSLSPSECRLLDYEKLPLAEYYETDNPITLTSPSSSGSYGYYIQCRNQNNYNITAVSEEIIVNAVAVSVSLLKSFDTALPSSDYNFAFVPYSSPNVEYLNHVSCRLLDSDKNKLKPQDDTWISVNLNEPNGIYHKLPGGYLGSFGYYIRCRNDVVTIAEADSDKMTITTYCPEGKKLYEGICVAPGISASDCVIETGKSSCNAAINWEIPSLDGVWAITANIPAPNTTVVDIVDNIGQVHHTLPGVSDFPFFLYNDGVEFGLSRAYARCRPGTVWTFSPDGTTGTCEILQNSIDVTICSIPLGGNSCQTEASWALDNIPPEKNINDFYFTYPKNKLVDGGGLVGDDRKQTLYDVTLFHGDNDFKIFDGADLIGEKNILGACVENTEWDIESRTCVIKEPEINYFKAEPETIFKGQSTTLSWNFEEDRVDYCLLEKKLIIDEIQELLKTIEKEEYQSSLKDSPSGTTVYYMTCYKDGLDPTDTKEAIVSVIDMVIEEK